METDSESGNIIGVGEVEIQSWEFLGGEEAERKKQGDGDSESSGCWVGCQVMSPRGELEVHRGCQDLWGIQGMIERSVDDRYMGTASGIQSDGTSF